jgi:hypothetical protein
VIPQVSSVSRCWIAISLLMTGLGTACRAWHTERIAPAPESVLTTRPPARIRLTRTDGSQIVLEHPVLVADTLLGTWSSHGQRWNLRFPLTEIRQIETRRFSPVRTVGLGLGVAAGVAAAVSLVIAYWILAGGVD